MAARIAAIIFILLGASLAWAILWNTLIVRTAAATDTQRSDLGALWGPEQSQSAPTFSYSAARRPFAVPIDASHVSVNLQLDQRRKGLLWYNTYEVAFAGTYQVSGAAHTRRLTFSLPLPADKGVYDDLRVAVNYRAASYTAAAGYVTVPLSLHAGEGAVVSVSYTSRGLGRWFYTFGSGVNAVRNFDLRMQTNFRAIDFPADTLAPTAERETPDGWDLTWQYRNLIAGQAIGMVFPERLQPGPLAQRITFWAPLSLLFYFFVLFILTVMRRVDLHPMNYFFLAASFFAFHLL